MRSLLISVAYLTLPVWGIVCLLAPLSLRPRAAQTPGDWLVFVGLLAPFVGATPIYRMSGEGAVFKTLVFIFYYAASVVGMFVFGWAAIGVFGIAK